MNLQAFLFVSKSTHPNILNDSLAVAFLCMDRKVFNYYGEKV